MKEKPYKFNVGDKVVGKVGYLTTKNGVVLARFRRHSDFVKDRNFYVIKHDNVVLLYDFPTRMPLNCWDDSTVFCESLLTKDN